MKPRVLQLIDSFDNGGSERQALELTRLLHASGKFEVCLASLKPDGVLRSSIENLQLGEIPSYPLQSFYDRNAVAQMRRFVHHLRASKIDLLHTHDFYTNIFGMTAGFLAGVPVRVASRRETNGMRTPAQLRAQRVAYSLAHQIVANSGSVRAKLIEEGVDKQRISVVYNGLDSARVAPPNNSREEILRALGIGNGGERPRYFVTIVANMRHEVKDYPMFLRMAQRVARALPEVGFLLAGEGQLQESLQTMAAEFGIERNTFFLGRSENIAQLLSVSDVCALTSKAEGFSNSILEYMAAGRPVVATEVGGAREAIIEGETGYTVPAGNDRLMANAIVSLLRDPEKSQRMGERGQEVVEEKFSTASLLKNTEALYQKLLAPLQAAGASPPSQPESQSDLDDPLNGGSHSIANHALNSNKLRVRKAGLPPLRLLIIAPSLDILGGQAVQADRLITRLRTLPELEVGFLPINPRLPGALRRLQSIKYLRTVVTSVLYFAKLLRHVGRYDVVHIFSASYFSFVLAQTPAILIAKLFRKKVLLNYHSGEAEDHLTRWRTAVPTIRLVDEVAVPSPYLVRVFAKFGIQARAVNNLIDFEQFTFRERKALRPVFLSNRNLEKHYGVDRVLRAFALVQKQIPHAELLIAGEGSQRVPLEELSRDLDLQHVTFLGRVEHDGIADLYQRADIFLNGSEIDNQPLSILEAFACGLPVVTTDAGGIPDMVSAETGCLVSRNDHEAMAAAALRLLGEQKFATGLVERAREECAKYTWEALSDVWMGLYQQTFRSTDRCETKPVSRLAKLRRMSRAELRVRASQACNAFAERTDWSRLNRLPEDETLYRLPGDKSDSGAALLKHFQKGAVFASFDERDAVVNALRSRWPESESRILDHADRILEGEFDLLGFKNLSFGAPINWHLEPVSGKQSPLLHWSRIDYLNSGITGDKKVTWELNRHQHFLTLGQAYWLTSDEKYAAEFVEHLNSWMDQNPPKLGINWASSLEISFRSISWLWALHYFKESPSLEARTLTRALKFLYLSGRHLETYLSTYFSPNTHLTGEALGLFYLGTLLPEFKDAPRWRALGQKILLEQLPRQVKPDGVYFEQSSYYHRYTADFYTHFLILSRLSEPPASAGGGSDLEQTLQALLDHLMYITRPDGTSPLFGDDDGGRLLSFDGRAANDFRSTLATGAALFGRGDYKFVARELAEETLWLLGMNGAQAFDEIEEVEPASQSKAFPDGGYYVMRDGWHDQSNYLLLDCGPHGTDNCGHAHADALAIEVAVKGKPVLIDPGTNTYTGSKEVRDSYRGSAAHNVMLVDRQPTSIPDGPFSWKTTAACQPQSWISERRFDYVEGRHDGYERLTEPATYTRSILFLKNDYWIMRDSLSSQGDHDLELRFHFAPEARLEIESDDAAGKAAPREVSVSLEDAGLSLASFGHLGSWRREETGVSSCYGESREAAACAFSSAFAANRGESDEVITVLIPTQAADSEFRVEEVEAIGGRAFEVTSRDYCDLVMIRDSHGGQVETVRMVSDASWTWARFQRSDERSDEWSKLSELIVMDGKHLQLDGRDVLKSDQTINYLVASRTGDRFRVETSAGLLDLSFPIEDWTQLFSNSNQQSMSPAVIGAYNVPRSWIRD